MVETKKQLKISLPSIIADELRHDILLHILKEGELLNEVALAEKYGVSRGPIRQAISMLSNEGIVENLSNGRTKVIGFKSADMQDYYNLRLFIESESVKKILLQPDDSNFREWIEQLNHIIDLSGGYQNPLMVDKINELDIEFHLSIVERANSQISKQIWKALSNFNRSIMALKKLYLSDQNSNDYEIISESHIKIVKGLSERDLEGVLKELAWHIQNSIVIYQQVLADISKLYSNG